MELVEGENVSSLKSIAQNFEAGRFQTQGKSFKWIQCRYYKEGQPTSCRGGNTCAFAHGQEQLIQKPESGASVDGEPRGVKRNARAANLPVMCMHHLRGSCDKGDDCQFFHDEEKFKKAIPPSYKTTLCENYMGTGHCKRGLACSFAHGRFELRPFDYKGDFDKKIKEMPNWKTTLCQFFIKTGGNCRNGAECDYAHGEKELRAIRQSAFDSVAPNAMTGKPGAAGPLCRYFSQGDCKLGTKCKFSHGVVAPAVPAYDYTSDVTPANMVATATPHPVAAMVNKEALYSEFMEFLDQKFQGASRYPMKQHEMIPAETQYVTVMPRARNSILGAGASPQPMMAPKYNGVVPARSVPTAAATGGMIASGGMPNVGAVATPKGVHSRGMTFQNSNQYATSQDPIYEDLLFQ